MSHQSESWKFSMTKNGESLLESGGQTSLSSEAAMGASMQTSPGKQSRMSSISAALDKNFKNRKVVAWLTNRPVEEEKYEREQFFKMLNQ